jgi:hypothetical protein
VSDDRSPYPQASYTDTVIEKQLRSIVSSVAEALQPLRRRRRLLLLCSTALIFLAILPILAGQHAPTAALLRSKPPNSLDAVHFSHLASSLTGYEFSNVNNEKTFVVGEHHTVQGNYPDDYQWIDPYSRKPFVEIMHENGMNNNAMGRMPAGSPYDALVVARGLNDRYMDPIEQIPYVNLTIVGQVFVVTSTKPH